jgi:conjugal transfer pilus assembly protein TraE
MEYKVATGNIDTLSKQRNLLGLLLGIMFLSNIFLSISILVKDTRTVIVPAGFTNEVAVSSSGVSNSYLEEMTSFFLSYLLDLSPSNINYRSQVILRHVMPEYYQTMNNYFKDEIKKHNDYSLSTNFTIDEFDLDEKELTAIAKGVLVSNFGKNGIQQEPKNYLIKYRYKAGKLLIEKFGVITDEEIEGKAENENNEAKGEANGS